MALAGCLYNHRRKEEICIENLSWTYSFCMQYLRSAVKKQTVYLKTLSKLRLTPLPPTL